MVPHLGSHLGDNQLKVVGSLKSSLRGDHELNSPLMTPVSKIFIKHKDSSEPQTSSAYLHSSSTFQLQKPIGLESLYKD